MSVTPDSTSICIYIHIKVGAAVGSWQKYKWPQFSWSYVAAWPFHSCHKNIPTSHLSASHPSYNVAANKITVKSFAVSCFIRSLAMLQRNIFSHLLNDKRLWLEQPLKKTTKLTNVSSTWEISHMFITKVLGTNFDHLFIVMLKGWAKLIILQPELVHFLWVFQHHQPLTDSTALQI